jgi:RNA 2',3'-cyclic 3'-phosphodiesterase
MGRDRSARPEAKPDRLFVAIEIPDDAKTAVEEAFRPWREAFPQARWAPRENWHVTVKFLGRTWPRLREWVPARIADAAGSTPPFEVALSGVGSFPSRRKGRVLWAGLDDGGELSSVAARVDAALADEFAAETRPFHAHLTVARSDPPIPLPDGFASTRLATPAWTVDGLVLFRSHLRRPAPIYEPIGRFELGAGRPGSEG